MRPTDFINFDGGSSPTLPIVDIHGAMQKDICIVDSELTEYEILSYYYHNGQMVVDICPKRTK